MNKTWIFIESVGGTKLTVFDLEQQQKVNKSVKFTLIHNCLKTKQNKKDNCKNK